MSEDSPRYGTSTAPRITSAAAVALLRRELASARAAGETVRAQALALAVEALCERFGIG